MEYFAHPYCPNCGHQFSHKIDYDGKLKGGLSGAAAGAILGGQIGIAMGPLGAMAGTLPGAILGGVFGKQIGSNIDNPTCPKCGFKFTLSDTIRKYSYKIEGDLSAKEQIVTNHNISTTENLPEEILLLFKQNRAFEIAELLFEYVIEGKDEYVNEILNELRFRSPAFSKKTELILIDLKSRLGI